PRRRDTAYLQKQLLIAQNEEAGIQLQAEEYDLMVIVADLDEIEEVNANCILMADLQQASTSVQNVRNQVAQNAIQNPRVQNTGNQNGSIGVPGNANQNLNGNGNANQNLNGNGVGHFARNCTVRPKRRDAAYLQTQLLIAQKKEARIQLQAEKFDLMTAAAYLDEIEEVNANCILMANL
nr:hypothetical protein [Tanacetum cinerariifolium]